MGRRKCVFCEKWIGSDEEFVPFKSRYVHKDCFNIIMRNNMRQEKERVKTVAKEKKKTNTKKPKLELKNEVSEEEYKEKVMYYNKVRELMKVDQLEARIYALSERYISKYGFTWMGMYNTLKYFFEVLGNDNYTECVFIIPYNYTNAETFYSNIETNEKIINEEKNIAAVTVKRKVTWKKKEDTSQLIDIGKIGCESC